MSANFGVLKKTQRDRVRDLLWDCAWHSAAELHKVGGVRYGARILELKRLGYTIDSVGPTSDGSKSYRLTSHVPGVPQGKRVKVYLTPVDVWNLIQGYQPSKAANDALRDAYDSFMFNRDKL